MWFEGKRGDDLEIETDSKAVGIRMEREETIVIATTTTKTVEITVESYTRDKNEINLAMIGRSLRFHDAKRAFNPLCVRCYFDRYYIITDNCRKNDTLM